MTVSEAIERSNRIYPDELDGNILYSWINELEDRIARELFGKEGVKIQPSDGSKTLTAPDAYAEIYPAYIMMKREFVMGSTEKFVNCAAVFGEAFKRYCDYVSRTQTKEGSSYRFVGSGIQGGI